MAFLVAGRLKGIRDATSMPVWTLPCKAGQPVSLPPGSWALAKPGEVAPCEGPTPEPPGPASMAAKKNDVDIFVFGVRRCGNHGIIRWLLGQFPHIHIGRVAV